jgi:hypothetical protein
MSTQATPRHQNFQTDLRSFAGTHLRRFIGFAKKGAKTTVSVNPGTVNAGVTKTVAVTLTGALLTRRHQKVIAIPSAASALAGFEYQGITITADDQATITLKNITGSPILPAAHNWDLYFFKR